MKWITLGLLAAAMIMSAIRLAKGPSLADRVMALDLLGFISASVVLAIAAEMAQPVLLDIVLVFSVVGFFGTVAFARYLEVRRLDDD